MWGVYVGVYVCVCVRARSGEKLFVDVGVYLCCMFVCVCVYVAVLKSPLYSDFI